jgi:hypothetical protein
MAFAGMKTMGPECCCDGCNDLYIIQNGGSVLRGYRVGSTITNLANTGFGFQTVFNTLVVDYYNKYVFSYRGSTKTILRYNLELGDVATVCTPTRLAATVEFMGVACDPINQRLFYATPESTSTGQIRSINYDGTGDVQLTTETIPVGTAYFAPILLTYDPTNNRLYYATEPNPFDDSFIKYINADDGTGKTTIISNLATAPDTSLLQSLDVANTRQRIIWSINELRSGVQTYKLNHANLDGTDVVTILSRPVANGQIYQAHVSEKNDAIYFVTGLASSSASGVDKIDFDGVSIERIMSGADGDIPFGSASGGVAFTIGCGFETTGSSTLAL